MGHASQGNGKRTRSDQRVLQDYDWDKLKTLVNADAEAGLIAAVFMQPELYAPLSQQVHARDFFYNIHGSVWWAIGKLDEAQQGIDPLSVEDYIRTHAKLSDEEAIRIGSMPAALYTMEGLSSYVRIVTELAIRRRLLRVADEQRKRAFNLTMDVEQVIDESQCEFQEATETRDLLQSTHISSGGAELWDMVEARHENNAPDGVSTGFRELDQRLDGLMPGELIMIGGDAGMGKTTLMLSILMNIVQAGKPCVLFSIEMSKREIAQNLTCMLSRIPKSVLRKSLLTDQQMRAFVDAQNVLHKLPLYVFGKDMYDDLTPSQFDRQVRALKAQTDIAAAFIDGLWLMSPDVTTAKQTSWENAKSITKDLIGSAERLRVPVVLMHQYAADYSSRMQSTQRKIKRPHVGDFADGRQAVRNPQVVIGMHRPDIYGGEDDVSQGLMQLYVIKNRNASGVDHEPVNLIFDKVTSSYKEPRKQHVDLSV